MVVQTPPWASALVTDEVHDTAPKDTEKRVGKTGCSLARRRPREPNAVSYYSHLSSQREGGRLSVLGIRSTIDMVVG